MTEKKTSSNIGAKRVECVEVLVSRELFEKRSDNLFWTLSVYSLQNQPVTKDRQVPHFEIFHFMVYDWDRTIKQLLDHNKLPYSIIQYFSPDTIYCHPNEGIKSPDNEVDFLAALSKLPGQNEGVSDAALAPGSQVDNRADLLTM